MTEYDATYFPGYYTYTMTPTTTGLINGLISYTYKGKVRVESHSWDVKVDDFAEIDNSLVGISGDITTLINKVDNIDADIVNVSSKIDNINVSGVPFKGEVIINDYKGLIKIKRFN
jgi:hypothetical protein